MKSVRQLLESGEVDQPDELELLNLVYDTTDGELIDLLEGFEIAKNIFGQR